MGFHLYKQSTTESGSIKLDYVKPLRLSGKDGLIATFIAAHSHDDLENWDLSTQEIAQLTGTEETELAVIFCSHIEDSSTISVSRVTSISGKSNIMDTEVLIFQNPIRHAEWEKTHETRAPANIRFPEKQDAKQIFESLLVKGGISKYAHSWKLAPPKMQIGGVIR